MGDITAGDVLGFFGDAQEGFRMYLRADRETREVFDVAKLIEATTPRAVVQWLRSKSLNVLPEGVYGNESPQKPRIERSNRKPFLPVFQHCLATLVLLRQRIGVSLGDLNSPYGVMLGDLAKTQTLWQEDLTPENTWDIICKFGATVTDAIYRRGQIKNKEGLLRTAVFFSAGRHLAQAISHF